MISDFFNKTNYNSQNSFTSKNLPLQIASNNSDSDIDEEAIKVTTDCELTRHSNGDLDEEANEIHLENRVQIL